MTHKTNGPDFKSNRFFRFQPWVNAQRLIQTSQPSMDPSLLNWLTSKCAKKILENALQRKKQGDSPLQIQKQLRQHLSPDQAREVMKQVDCRQRAAQKFDRAEQMFFTDIALQQASSLEIARYKSRRFDPQLGCQDWCCGIGGDLIGLAERVPHCVGIDRDSTLSHFARGNLEVYGLKANIRTADVTDLKADPKGLFHLDPARRSEGKRTIRMEAFCPPLETIEQILFETRGACIKLAPATDIPESWHSRIERQWVQSQGDCKQLLIWSGWLAQHAGRSTVVRVEGNDYEEFVEVSDKASKLRGDEFEYLYEPLSALRAAKLESSLATSLGAVLLNSRPSLLAADHLLKTPFARGFRILKASSGSTKQIRKDLRELDAGQVEFKCRPPFDELEKSISKFRFPGTEKITLIACQFDGRARIWLTQRI